MSGDGSRPRLAELGTYARLGFGMVTFGSATPVSKLVVESMPVAVASALRVAIGALALSPVVARDRRAFASIERTTWLQIATIALFGMFGFSMFMLGGMRLLSGVEGAIVMSSAPAVTAAASMVLLGDAVTWRKVVAVVLAVVGVLILHIGRLGGASESSAQGDLVLGSLLVFGAVCCEALYTLLGKRAAEKVDPVVVAFLAAVLAVPLFLPIAVVEWRSFTPAEVSTQAWLALFWYGAGTLALGTWLWYSGVRRAEGSVAAAFMGLMPASALVLSYLLLGEAFRLLHLAGFATVATGVLLVSWEHARHAQAS